MSLNKYADMRILNIKGKLNMINPEVKDLDDIDVVNVALVVFSLICDAHVNPELDRHLIVEDMLDDINDFDYYVANLMKQTKDTNEALNEYIDKHVELIKNEVKK